MFAFRHSIFITKYIKGNLCSVLKEEDEEEAAPKKQKMAFTVKLVKFDESKKIALIKEMKNLQEGMNLVQVNVQVGL